MIQTTPTADPKTGISQQNSPSQIISNATALAGPYSVPRTAAGIQRLSPTNLGGRMKGATVPNYERRSILQGHETELQESLGCETTQL